MEDFALVANFALPLIKSAKNANVCQEKLL